MQFTAQETYLWHVDKAYCGGWPCTDIQPTNAIHCTLACTPTTKYFSRLSAMNQFFSEVLLNMSHSSPPTSSSYRHSTNDGVSAMTSRMNPYEAYFAAVKPLIAFCNFQEGGLDSRPPGLTARKVA
jgi:hypothetical protein